MLKVYENQTVTFEEIEALEAGDVFCWQILSGQRKKEFKIYFLVLDKGYCKLDGLQFETYNLTTKVRQNFLPESLYSREEEKEYKNYGKIIWISKISKRKE